MKLITETNTEGLNYLTETKNGKKSQYIEGVFLQGELRNRNNRVYPINILEREVNKYIEEQSIEIVLLVSLDTQMVLLLT